ncbi:hypothetical protein M8J71_15510 [Pseudarthrobacter sp. R1]|uniref:hypothetical protein n=1 Tax=Pseudarthrobacter sp. R1 TaxID=2944934 RepID=UPI00210D5E64|nr:hypothetical protein [Pseudarthrobacter sp. R1]MCQ6271883.1 hypothetical protein [Pseudarthrobacter sp. R1]
MRAHDMIPSIGVSPWTVAPAPAMGPILIVYQDPWMAAEISVVLANAGWSLATAETAGTGEDVPAVVLLDGRDRARTARTRQSLPGAPALFVTTRENLDSLLCGGMQPADDCLTAPYAFDDLVLRLRRLTRYPTAASPGVRNHTARRGQVPIRIGQQK